MSIKLLKEAKRFYSCYCDGAVKNNGKKNPDAPTFGGVGIVILDDKEKIIVKKYFGYAEKGKFRKKVTNNNMELMAVINSIKLFIKNIKKSEECSLTIFSDSEYVVKGYNERIRKWIHNDWTIGDGSPVKNRELWVEILNLISNKKSPEIKFVHVDGHNGDTYNEMADKLAVQGKEEAITIMKLAGEKENAV